ncbi:transcriptional regulator, TetR family [Paenibacillus curdlanolyticus YK9]|uniref:Transcriptional regulator, TetR family n=1 Tax=Paenibacillus curdlanolyticus YK9 TaxID=717606 RepID=E0I9N7_9BACL|nr:TetR/AcrR family transcriptional regulator [Paenibacillus curdlanolyticus]EFM11121.1 transcriptional regulator, TetR family [Paenibacillus curdlanolyticus YK9]
MGRKQSFTETELLDVTKRLILDHGYDGFHLQLLSRHLPGARSTIYQYYSNKEEIVAACMKRVITEMLANASEVDETDVMEALQQVLLVYVEESKLHQLLGDAHKINTANSPAAKKDLAFVEEAHKTLKVQLTRLFGRAQQEGLLREDVPLPALIGVFFNLINTPNMLNVPTPQWGKLLFQMWMGGAKKE